MIREYILYEKRSGRIDEYNDILWAIKRFKEHLARHHYKESRANALMLSYLCFAREVGEEILRRYLEEKSTDPSYRMVRIVSGLTRLNLYDQYFMLRKPMYEWRLREFREEVLRKTIWYTNREFGFASMHADEIYDIDLNQC